MGKHVEVSSLWIGPNLPILQQMAIRSFLDHGHKYVLYTYDTPKGVPAGTEVRDANAILNSIKYPIEHFTSYALASDAFRFNLLAKEKNAFWVDTDIICLSDDIPTIGNYGLYDMGNEVISMVMAYPSDCAVAKVLAAFSLNPGYILPWDTVKAQRRKHKFNKRHKGEKFLYRYFGWYEIQIRMNIKEAFISFGMEDKITRTGGHTAFLMFPWWAWIFLFNGVLTLDDYARRRAWFIHAFNEAQSREKFDVLNQTCRRSVIGELFHRHMPGVLRYRL